MVSSSLTSRRIILSGTFSLMKRYCNNNNNRFFLVRKRRNVSTTTTTSTIVTTSNTNSIIPTISTTIGDEKYPFTCNNRSITAAAALAATALTLLTTTDNNNNNTTKNKTYCCGLIGVVGSSTSDDNDSSSNSSDNITTKLTTKRAGGKRYYPQDARTFLLEGLNILKKHGYDSAGMATTTTATATSNNNNNKNNEQISKFNITKYANVVLPFYDDKIQTTNGRLKDDSIDLVAKHSKASIGDNVGIAHTRWATHGGKTDDNAHPHLDSSGKIALVHNGTLNNANELRRELQSLGHVFTSKTDTEVIAKLIGHYYNNVGNNNNKTISVKEATERALDRCDGTWGLCIMCTDTPDELVVACNGSPLVIGIGDDRTFVSSESSTFQKYTNKIISMKDGEIGVLNADSSKTLDLSRISKNPQLSGGDIEDTSPDPYRHWTIKEISEQPEALGRALGFGSRLTTDEVTLGGLERNLKQLSQIKFLTLIGCGSALNAAKYGELIMKQLNLFTSVSTLDSTGCELCNDNIKDLPQNIPNKKEIGLLVISQSGETKDTYNAVSTAMNDGVTVMSVVNTVGSLIARTTKVGVYCNAGYENAVVSTKTFTTQVTVLALIALWFKQIRNKVSSSSYNNQQEMTRLKEALMRLPITFGMTIKKTHDQCKDIAKELNAKQHCFVLGKGYGEPIAMEGALKLKEMSYLHAEGYSGGALKHGPFALIENDETGKFGATPIIMLILDDHHSQHMRTAAEEVKARGAKVIIITDKPYLAKDLDDNPIVIPSNGPLTALGAILPLQLIAYELALLRGINPDTPRNLVKSYSSV